MKFRLLFISSLVFAAFGSAIAQVPAMQNVSQNVSRDYLLGPGDVVTVTVVGEKEFDFSARIDNRGNIRIPFSETPIPAKCRTELELEADVRAQIKKIIREPMMTLHATSINNRPMVTVHGEVRQPSHIRLENRARLSNMLTTALGPTEAANGLIQIERTTAPVCEGDFAMNSWTADPNAEGIVKIFSLADMEKGGEYNPVILPGDQITLLKAGPVFVNGEVIEPGARLIKERGLTLIEAIAQVGGLRAEAKKKDVKIYRQKPGSDNRDEIVANLDLITAKQEKDIPLMPYDIIVVGKAKESFGMMMFKFVVGVGKQAALAAGTGGGYKVTSF